MVPGSGAARSAQLPLISRWRAKWFAVPASAPWVAMSDPGSFTTEHRMLRKIKAQAEHAARPASGRAAEEMPRI